MTGTLLYQRACAKCSAVDLVCMDIWIEYARLHSFALLFLTPLGAINETSDLLIGNSIDG